MKDDLVKRLRAWSGSPFDEDAHEAAKHIEMLEAKVRFYERRERDRWVGSQMNCR